MKDKTFVCVKSKKKVVCGKVKLCESCGQKPGTTWVRGTTKQLYCKECAFAYGKKNWVN